MWQAIATAAARPHPARRRSSRWPRCASGIVALARRRSTRLGWERAPGEDDLTGKLRGLLVGSSPSVGRDEAVAARCEEVLAEAGHRRSGTASPRRRTRSPLHGDSDDYERFLTGFRTAATPQEMLRNLYALAEFDAPELFQRTLELAVSGDVKTQNAPFLLNRCIANRFNGMTAWRFVREHWQHANEQFPVNTIVRMIDPVKLLNTPEAEADVGRLLRRARDRAGDEDAGAGARTAARERRPAGPGRARARRRPQLTALPVSPGAAR